MTYIYDGGTEHTHLTTRVPQKKKEDTNTLRTSHGLKMLRRKEGTRSWSRSTSR